MRDLPCPLRAQECRTAPVPHLLIPRHVLCLGILRKGRLDSDLSEPVARLRILARNGMAVNKRKRTWLSLLSISISLSSSDPGCALPDPRCACLCAHNAPIGKWWLTRVNGAILTIHRCTRCYDSHSCYSGCLAFRHHHIGSWKSVKHSSATQSIRRYLLASADITCSTSTFFWDRRGGPEVHEV